MALFLPDSMSASRRAAQVVAPGTGAARLVDGRLAPLYRSASGATSVQIQITLSQEERLDFWALHDLRLESAELASVEIIWSGSTHTYHPEPGQTGRVVRGMWGRFPEAVRPAFSVVSIVITPTAPTRLYLGEVSLGKALRIPYSISGAVRTDEPLVVVNGDARVMAARARSVLDLDFPPSFEDELGEVVRLSGGALHPLVAVPAEASQEVILGHLSAGSASSQDVTRVYSRGLMITEMQRALR